MKPKYIIAHTSRNWGEHYSTELVGLETDEDLREFYEERIFIDPSYAKIKSDSKIECIMKSINSENLYHIILREDWC